MSRNFEVLTGLAARIADKAVPSAERSADPAAAPARELYASSFRKESGLIELVHAILACIAGGRRVLLLTEATRESARSVFLCTEVAEELSLQITGNVLLVDANFDAPRAHRRFDRPASPGLSDSLRSAEPLMEFVQEITPKLWLLAAGNNNGLSAPHDAFRRRIAEMRQVFEVILIDAPSALNGRQMSSFGELTDGAILLLRANSTRRESAARAKSQLEQARIPLIGAVLLDRTFPIPDKIYRTV
jgi:Mrp family chromosome partitioning ATPase